MANRWHKECLRSPAGLGRGANLFTGLSLSADSPLETKAMSYIQWGGYTR
jgi:hypothetical protein